MPNIDKIWKSKQDFLKVDQVAISYKCCMSLHEQKNPHLKF
jgi:hypothetical protein